MPDKFDLALDISTTHPQAVARYLEEFSPASASSFIDAVPDVLSRQILETMLPYHAAKCIGCLPVAAAARYVGALEARFAASILRHTNEPTREAVIAAMPRTSAARISVLLRYPLSVIGAWLNPTILVLPMDCRVADAKERLTADGFADYHRIYVVDANRRLKGFVRLIRLLQGDDTRQLGEYLENLPPPLRANTTLEMALDEPNWRSHDYLPVVDRHEILIGVLRYAELRAAVSKPKMQAVNGDLPGTFLDLAETCYLGLADVMNSSLSSQQTPATDDKP